MASPDHTRVIKTSSDLLLLIILPLALLGCMGADETAGGGFIVTDSAGLRIVQNAATRADPVHLRLRHDLQIGSVDEGVVFGNVAAIAVAPDEGSFAVLDTSNRTVMVFDSEGELRFGLGRPGSGPGEFSQALGTVAVLPGDSVLVSDLGHARVSVFAPDGGFVRSIPLDPSEGIPVRWVLGPEGRLVEQLDPLPGSGEQGVVVLRVIDTDRTKVDTLRVIPHPSPVDVGEHGSRLRMFAPAVVWTPAPEGIAVGTGSAYSITLSGFEASLDTRVTKESTPSPVSPSDRDRARELLREAFLGQGVPEPAINNLLAGLIFPDTYPHFTDIVGVESGFLVKALDDGASVQIEPSPHPLAADYAHVEHWDYFSWDGERLGTVQMPGSFRPLASTDIYLYGVSLGDSGEPQVVRAMVVR